MAIVILVLTIGAVVAIPLGLKLLGVAFAKTIVVETSKVVRDLGLDKIARDTVNETKQLRQHYDRVVVPMISKAK